MPRFILKERALIANDLRDEGYEFDFTEPAPPHFLPQDDAAITLRFAYDAAEVQRCKDNQVHAGRVVLAQLEPAHVAAIRQIVREELLAEQAAKAEAEQAAKVSPKRISKVSDLV